MKSKIFSLHLLLACCFLQKANAQETTYQTSTNWQTLRPGEDYKTDAVLFKLLPEYREAFAQHPETAAALRPDDPVLQKICAAQGDFSAKKLFPHHPARAAGKGVDLSLMGELQFAETVNVPKLCRLLMSTGRFEYVEPYFLFRTGGGVAENKSGSNLKLPPDFMPFTPNDSLVAQQWHLSKIHAFEAWDVEQGDTNVCIGIVDTGTDPQHPDLKGNIAYNFADPVNGLDDDGNGYVDDYLGWDLFHNDNGPHPADPHGTGTGGIAGATTNNVTGLAAPGFKCRILPVKCSSDDPNDGNISAGVLGMVYAADRGCKVINCSWGGGASSVAYDDIIKYVTLEKDALVVSVAGNSNNSIPFAPASHDYALSVAATNNLDNKQSFSNFNHLVDISAPSIIWATWDNSGYLSTFWGTSASAPLVAGAAALVRSHFPDFTALQTAERLRITADDISALNPSYPEQLGKGRLNMYRALTDPPSPAVRLREAVFTDGNDNILVAGDTVRMSGLFINYLADATNLTVTLSSPSPHIAFIEDTFSQNLLATLDTATNEAQPFVFVISPDAPDEIELQLRLGFQADIGYVDWQWQHIQVNMNSADIFNGTVGTTVGSTGRFGYRKFYGDALGVLYSGNDVVDAAGALMLATKTPTTKVSDAALLSWGGTSTHFSNDFKIVERIHGVPAGATPADTELACAFNDSTSATNQLGMSVRQRFFGWTGDNFLITEFEITNQSGNTYDPFYVGLWGEGDTHYWLVNRAERDSALRLGYIYATVPGNPYIGFQLLNDLPFNLYVYEDPPMAGVNVFDNFSTDEKYTTLSTSRTAGGFGDADGSDVGMVVSAAPFVFAPGETVRMAFALLVADSLEALRNAAMQAQMRYESLVATEEPSAAGSQSKLKIYPNPARDRIWIETSGLATARNATVEVYDLSGKTVSRHLPTSEGNLLNVDTSDLPAGMYLLRLRTEAGVRTGKFVKQ